jgi:hypothetical protein
MKMRDTLSIVAVALAILGCSGKNPHLPTMGNGQAPKAAPRQKASPGTHELDIPGGPPMLQRPMPPCEPRAGEQAYSGQVSPKGPPYPGPYRDLPVHPRARLISGDNPPECYVIPGESIGSIVTWYKNTLESQRFKETTITENPYRAPELHVFIRDRTFVRLSFFPKEGQVDLIVDMGGED